ncbi:Predicted metal-binding protein [Cohaesibacter marisflavi]|uniref:Predicted metal-binding protein n=1 Tax=Cohaesibacter marisflavi TaxID=655353 RepID=A0A1I5AQU8_9HYPH|nr:DUF1636 domain-containing protein [Cohaesibacter marisflavi]SFN64815.1 Predicted metal-binding protein [Cohaesibacter marisflavi]
MKNKAILQICSTCNSAAVKQNPERLATECPEGEKLLGAVQSAVKADADLDGQLVIQAARCMSSCKRSCVVALLAKDKYQFVVGELDSSADRVDDLVAFAKSYVEAEDGLPQWRERPQHIRKNTIARLHPFPSEFSNDS